MGTEKSIGSAEPRGDGFPPDPQAVHAAPCTRLADGRVECGLCPHRCALKEGQRGICYVRRAEGGAIRLSAFGRVSGMAADPIEKKPLYHFLPGTESLSVGTIGCNLSCRFCQNWHISAPSDDSALSGDIVPPDALVRAARGAGCPSVSFTYNEPIVTFESTLAYAAACRAAGLKTVAVTAGYIEPGPRAVFFGAMDAANVDLKAFDGRFYRRLCGARLRPVLDTLEFIRRETSCWLELTTLLIPGENDSESELRDLARWILDRLGPDVPMHFSAFHPTHRMSGHAATLPETVRRARAIAKAEGVRHVYTGNIADDEGSTTVCHACGIPLIRRHGFVVAGRTLASDGRCPGCNAPCAGVW